jgi:hypothetical protein
MLQDATSDEAPTTLDAALCIPDVVAAIVVPNCATSGCHDPLTHEHGMDLSTATNIYDAWINKKGLDHCRNAARVRVVPGSPATSYVMAKLTAAETCELSDRMPPPPREPLSEEQIEVIRAWIAAGARLDSVRCDSGSLDEQEAGRDAVSDVAPDLSLDTLEDAPVDGEGRDGDPVAEGSVVTDAATADVDDTSAPPDSSPCNEASAPKSVRKAPPPGFMAPAGGDQIDCTSTKPCPPGLLCVGGGCDDGWQCFVHAQEPGEHPCPTDSEAYCGCDGVTFMAIRTCPDRPYERVGACEDGVSCDPTQLRCSVPEPRCPAGYVPSVVDGNYGGCVPYSLCQCEFVWQCPHREQYKCDTTTRRCGLLPPNP